MRGTFRSGTRERTPVEEGPSFAGWLRERRVLAGLTQAQLAGRAGLSLRAVRNAELGSVRNPRPETERR
ncbi:helix-turn-helix domain-containing protein, partial [Amycolatopsis sp. SID8362]|nr:helix-turn-helix domain-containing protein [Amycolatopsis sp. SID8362]NED42633.1 helix-turn-helix transcriptional regulator [Amycolatopsis sp. SID8362]